MSPLEKAQQYARNAILPMTGDCLSKEAASERINEAVEIAIAIYNNEAVREVTGG